MTPGNGWLLLQISDISAELIETIEKRETNTLQGIGGGDEDRNREKKNFETYFHLFIYLFTWKIGVQHHSIIIHRFAHRTL